MDIFAIIQVLGEVLDLFGVLVIVCGVIFSTAIFIKDWLFNVEGKQAYQWYRQNLGRVILLGLEFLVAGDIIRSVAGTPTFTSVGILAIIVLIRSFLSINFEMEVEGHWPWNKGKAAK